MTTSTLKEMMKKVIRQELRPLIKETMHEMLQEEAREQKLVYKAPKYSTKLGRQPKGRKLKYHFVCEPCKKSFRSEGRLTQHAHMKHDRQAWYYKDPVRGAAHMKKMQLLRKAKRAQ